MTPNDPRHGTAAGYSQHRRDNEPACPPCRRAASARAQAQRDSEEVALTDGAWRLDPWKRVLVWVPKKWEPPKPDLSGLIACPTCHARYDQTCRTASGHRTTNHGSRLIGRYCPCGSPVEYRKRYCETCAAEVTRMAKKRWRKARKVAA